MSTPRRRPEFTYPAAVTVGRGLFTFWRLKPIVAGAENIPAEGGAVIAMTHFGYLEFALVEWATWRHNRRRIRFMAKKPVFDKAVVGSLMRSMRHISVDMTAGADAYASAVAALRGGELIGVFPEAGVSASFTVRELKTGAVRLAAEAGVPLIPVAVWGGQRLMTKGRKVRMRERFGVPVSFAFGTPLPLTDDPRADTEALRTELESLVERLQVEYPVDGTGQWWQPHHLGGGAMTPEDSAVLEAEIQAERAARRAARSQG